MNIVVKYYDAKFQSMSIPDYAKNCMLYDIPGRFICILAARQKENQYADKQKLCYKNVMYVIGFILYDCVIVYRIVYAPI